MITIALSVIAVYWMAGIWMLRRPKQAGPEAVGAKIKRYLLALLWLPIAILSLFTGGEK